MTFTETLEYEVVAPAQTSNPPPARYSERYHERTQKNETEACVEAIDIVFSSRTQEECETRLRETVWSTRAFEKLPKYRREYVRGYKDGALDAASRIYGKPISKAPPAPKARIPGWVQALDPLAHWHRHQHGGGWVAHTAFVESTVYVGPEAAVYNEARVLGSAKIYGKSRIYDSAELYGSVHVRAGAHVCGTAQVSGWVRIIGALVPEGSYTGEFVIRAGDALSEFWTSRHTSMPPASAPDRHAPTYISELRPT